MCVQLRVECAAARVRERGCGEIAGRPILLAALFSDARGGKGSSSRNAMRAASSCAVTSRSSASVTASTDTDFGAEQVKS
jgi:hypothetical protein